MSQVHVASVEEERKLLPPTILRHSIRNARALGMEAVWHVDEATGKIESGVMIDTHRSLYFTFDVLQIDGGFEMFNQSDWMPCPED